LALDARIEKDLPVALW